MPKAKLVFPNLCQQEIDWKLSSPQKAYSLVASPAMAMEGNGCKRTSQRPSGWPLLFQKTVSSIFAQQDLIDVLDCDFWGFPIFWMAVLITVFLFLLQHCICNVMGADKKPFSFWFARSCNITYGLKQGDYVYPKSWFWAGDNPKIRFGCTFFWGQSASYEEEEGYKFTFRRSKGKLW